jgi:hypothetical protein
MLPFSSKSLFSRPLIKNVKIKACKITIILFILYGCEMCSHIHGEGHRLRVFEKDVLRQCLNVRERGSRGILETTAHQIQCPALNDSKIKHFQNES